MRKIRDIAEAALDYTDIAGGSDILSNTTARQKAALCTVITGALQELHTKKPEAFKQRQGFTLQAPVTGTVNLTAGSTQVSGLGSFGKDVRGQSVRLSTVFNQIAPASTSPGDHLLLPWSGTTGDQGITIYNDAVLVPGSVFSVIGDVRLEGYGALKPAPDRATYTAYRDELWLQDYGMRQPTLARPRWSGLPEVWWAEPAYIQGAISQVYLRFAPIPDRAYTVSFDLGFLPRELQPADLINDSLVLPVPGDFCDAILIPFVLQRWTGTPWFRNTEAKQEIGRQYTVAKGMLEDWGAQVQLGSQIVVAAY